MGNDLVKLYKELDTLKNATNPEAVKNHIEQTLYTKLRENFLELLEIGEVIGYDKLEAEMRKAVDLIGQIKK